MSIQLEAVYENGVFRPLEPVDLPESQRVTVTVEDTSSQAHYVLPPDRWQTFCDALDTPPRDISALRELLKKDIKASLETR